jgi:hypothetical protein
MEDNKKQYVTTQELIERSKAVSQKFTSEPINEVAKESFVYAKKSNSFNECHQNLSSNILKAISESLTNSGYAIVHLGETAIVGKTSQGKMFEVNYKTGKYFVSTLKENIGIEESTRSVDSVREVIDFLALYR